MRGNEAQNLISEDQIGENFMEARMTRVESDVANKWIIGTAIACVGTAVACAGVAFTLARAIH